MDPETILTWRRQGVSLAEIGHRLGVSAERVQEMLAEQGVETELSPGEDDHGPNAEPVR
jgi:uncharacterized protein (DUF433 family)